MDNADVRLLLQMVTFYDWVMNQDHVITQASWDKQMGAPEKAALQRLIDEIGL